jgi:hypothetical protein
MTRTIAALSTPVCPPWCVKNHTATDATTHHSAEIRALHLRSLDGGDGYGLSASLVRLDPEPGFPGTTYEIQMSSGGFHVDLGADNHETVTAELESFGQQLLILTALMRAEAAGGAR